MVLKRNAEDATNGWSTNNVINKKIPQLPLQCRICKVYLLVQTEKLDHSLHEHLFCREITFLLK